MATLISLASFALLCGSVGAVPNPQLLGSDLTIITHNDLYGNASTRQDAAVILSAQQSNSKSQSACALLGETLWNPGKNTDVAFLKYLDYEKAENDTGRYWIGSGAMSACRAITTLGKIHTESCNTTLPALCSQSALLSFPGDDHVNPKWQTTVNTGNAMVLGYRDKLSFRFLGLKYASLPARFDYSTYLAPSENLSALKYGDACLQSGCGKTPCSEDCLFMNIWTPTLPAKPSPKKKAVMLWIHGGGFLTGFGSDTTFDGGNMASRGDVVVVTVNYRLSTLGFLALDNTSLKGNYWLSDLIAALDWVQAHIEDFGGDKDRVTVFGQSAGAAAVRALLASPLAKGKFSRAIMQSCPGGSGHASIFNQYLTIPQATNMAKGLLNETGCAISNKTAVLECLRAQDPAKLIGSRNAASSPVVDGTYLISDALLLDGIGPHLNVAVMGGVMHDDGDPFTAFPRSTNASQELTQQGYDAAKLLGSGAFQIPHGANTTLDIFNLTARVTTDAQFRCLAQATAFSAAKNSVFPVMYSYEIDRSYQISEYSPNPPTCEAPITARHPFGDPALPYFKCHSGDLYLVFGTAIRQGRHPRDEGDIPFSQYLLDSWTAFGRTKNPNPALDFLQARGFTNTSATVKNTAPWKAVEAGNPNLRALNVKPGNEGFRELRQCEILDLPLEYLSQRNSTNGSVTR